MTVPSPPPETPPETPDASVPAASGEPRPPRRGRASAILRRARPRLVFAGKALVVTVLLAATTVLILRARRHRIEERRHLVDLAVWSVAETPRWASLDDIVRLRDSTALVGRALPLYDRAAAELVRAQLEAAPLTRRVVSLRRIPPGAIDAVLELRRPLAAVAVPDGGWVEVDRDGVVLGPARAERPVRDGLPLRLVTGGGDPPVEPGAVCGEDVRAGLRLCALLDAYRDGLGARILRGFDEVDVSNFAGRRQPAASELLLRAAPLAAELDRPTPCVVEWGRLGTRHGEPPFEAKAARLERAIAVFADFDGIARVRVAFDTLSVLPVDGPEGAWLPALADQTLGR